MGLFSPSKSSKRPAVLASVGIATLGGAQVTLTLLEKMMDGVQIPFVKGVAGAAVEVIKIARVIKTNKEDCDELLKRSTSLLVVILSSFKGRTESSIPSDLRRGVEQLTNNFHDVLAILRTIDMRAGKKSVTGLSRALVYHYDNAEKLKGCSAKLDWAMQAFQVTSKVDSCLRDQQYHEELIKGQEELRDGQGEMQKNLQDGQAEIRKGLAEIRDAMTEQAIADVISGLPSTVMPADTRLFGRQEYIECAIELLLSSSTSRMAILGPGGIGKTSVALKIVHNVRVIDRFGKNCHWIPCEQAPSITLLIELLAKSLKIPSSMSNDRFRDVIETLESSSIPHLFLFDNFETPWDIEGQQSHLGDILTRLASVPSLSFILTMRGSQPPYCDSIEWSHPLLPSLTQLELGAAEETFLKISPKSAGDKELPTLLNQLDCMPLAIVLMAKLARAGDTVPQLLSQWESERTSLLCEPGGDRRTSIEISIKLSLESRSVRTSKDAINLLGVIAALPGGCSISRLPDICPSIPAVNTVLRGLLNAALIHHNADKSLVQILSPIRSYVLLHHPLGAALLQGLRAFYYKFAEKCGASVGYSDFLANFEEMVKEETNMEAILLDALHDTTGDKGVAVSASVEYSRYLGCTQPRTNILEAAERVARMADLENHAECLLLLSTILFDQDQIEAAQRALEEARVKYINLGDHWAAACCQSKLGNIFLQKDQFEAAQTAYEEALEISTSLGNQPGAADCLRALGYVLYERNQPEAAWSALEEAKAKYTSLGHHVGIAQCLTSLGIVLVQESQYEAASHFYEEALAEYSNVGYQIGVSGSLKRLAELYICMGRHEAAKSAIEEAMKSGNRHHIAACTQILGEVLYYLFQFDAACGVLEDAMTQWTKRGNRSGVAHCMWSLGRALLMQNQYIKAWSFLIDAKTEFINLGDHASVANCLLSMGDILFGQQRYEEAYEIVTEAKEQYTRLGNFVGIANSMKSLGDMLSAQYQHEAAQSAIEEARSEYASIGVSVGIADCMVALGHISQKEQKYLNALDQFEEARSLYSNIGSLVSVDQCSAELAKVHKALELSKSD